MTRLRLCVAAIGVAVCAQGCGSSGNQHASAGSGGAGGSGGSGGSPGAGGAGGAVSGSGGGGGASACADARTKIEAYAAAHPGEDGDFNAKPAVYLMADAAARELVALCGDDQRPVIPLLAWEHGGGDHAWIHPERSALYYCVYTPVNPSTGHWQYDAGADHVTADVSIGCPEENPCKDEIGRDQVMKCLGDPSNSEILVDVASLNDGNDVGLDLSESSTDLFLILEDGTRVHLLFGA